MHSTVPFFSIFSLLGFAASLVPLYWQFEAWNVGAVWYIFWIALSCFTQYFNAILWAGNTTTSVHTLCEISIRVAMAVSVGLPASSMVINRRLYIFACMPPTVEATKSNKHRAVIVDSFICGLFPTLYIALQAASQRHRFTILEDVGCFPDLSDTLPTYFLSFTAPLLLSFGSAVYCALSVIEMSASRTNFAEALSGHRNLTPSRFLRLHGLALATLFLTLPLDLLNVAANATLTALVTRVSGDAAPFSFNVVARIPRALWAASESAHAAVELGRWIAPVCAILFFAFFGLAAEARTHYARGFTVLSNALWNTLARIGWVRPLPPLPGTAHPL
ncbi:fungal pheromone STE3G-protein-coupled receptor, partial [Mycena albidolilacea]